MVTRLEEAHGRIRQRISGEARRLIRRAWLLADGNEDEFVAEAVAIADTARAAVVSEVDAYLTAYMIANGVPASPRGLDPERYRRPVAPEEQWQRPAKHMRMKLADGMEFAQAFTFGGHQASGMVTTDLQFAARTASRDWIADEPTASGYRRVLVGAVNCGLCVAASDQMYFKADLMPIHDRCNCSVAPVSLDSPRYGLSGGKYQEVLAQSGGDTSKSGLSKVRLQNSPDATPFQVIEHGELGPYLFDATHTAPLLDAAA